MNGLSEECAALGGGRRRSLSPVGATLTAGLLSLASLVGCGEAHRVATMRLDWHMEPHFPGMDLLNQAPPPVAGACVSVGDCPLRCVPQTVVACWTSCGTPGTQTCGDDQQWQPCVAHEVCDGLDNDCDGRVDNGNVCQVPLSRWDSQHRPGFDSTLDACGSSGVAGARGVYRWTVPGRDAFDSRDCHVPVTFASEGTYPVTVDWIDDDGTTVATATRPVVIRNLVVAAVGDSVASGEGNPEVAAAGSAPALWQDRRCHRSLKAGPALAARRLEEADDHSSVTFQFLACSGASVVDGMLGPYGGIESAASEPPLPGQIQTLQERLTGNPRGLDVLLMQIGANDVGFADIVERCAWPPVQLAGGDDLLSCANENARQTLQAGLDKLLSRSYPLLRQGLARQLPLPPHRVYLSEYFDPTRTDDGTACPEIRLKGAIPDGLSASIQSVVASSGAPGTAGAASVLPDVALEMIKSKGAAAVEALIDKALQAGKIVDGLISAPEVVWTHDQLMVPLNDTLRRAATANDWRFVPGLAAAFGSHGYCADDHWIVRYDESKNRQANKNGTAHPNEDGHRVFGDLLYQAVAADLAAASGPPP